jgi:hypothetical protein
MWRRRSAIARRRPRFVPNNRPPDRAPFLRWRHTFTTIDQLNQLHILVTFQGEHQERSRHFLGPNRADLAVHLRRAGFGSVGFEENGVVARVDVVAFANNDPIAGFALAESKKKSINLIRCPD